VSVRNADEVSLNRTGLYVALNILVAGAAITGSGLHPGLAHPAYVILLFALCSTPILEAHTVNGPYSLLILWSCDYFLMYGALDLKHLVLGSDGPYRAPDGIVTSAEAVILIGAALVQLAYRLACRSAQRRPSPIAPRDWPEHALVLVGILMWAVSTKLNWDLAVHDLVEKSNAATEAGLERLGGVSVGIHMIARMAQPLSILMLAYAQCRYRRAYMAPLLVGVVVFQLIYGFVIDFKTEALIGGVLVVLTNLLVHGRVPKAWVALMLVVMGVGFPVLQANRVIRDERGENSTKASMDIPAAIERALAATDRTATGKERTQTALERLTTKGSVEIIVQGTGVTTPFQHGHTLIPLVETFIPRLVWADKPSIPTGQIMNREFHVSDALETYISPSHLGELYWNFGWAGVVIGMSMIGALFGWIGAKFDLSKAATVTRILVIVVTVREVILASEGELATHYVVWLRSLAGIGLLHVMFARMPWRGRTGAVDGEAGDAAPAVRSLPQRYPNLLS